MSMILRMKNIFSYDNWNHKKQEIKSSQNPIVYFKEREIWWCSVGLNIGFEENGKGELFNRPVLILRKYGPYTFIGVPISNTTKAGSFYFRLNTRNVSGTCLLTHIRLFDSKRLTQKIETMQISDFFKIKKSIKDLL